MAKRLIKDKKKSNRAITGIAAVKHAFKKDFERLGTPKGRKIIMRQAKDKVTGTFKIGDNKASAKRLRRDYPGLYKKGK